MAEQLEYGFEARLRLRKGIETLSHAVRATLGPRGRTVLIERAGASPLITKDGMTVAKAIHLENPVEEAGIRTLLQGARRMAEVVGDGTTTTILLTNILFQEGFRRITAGAETQSVRRGMELAASAVIAELSERSRPAKSKREWSMVAAIAGNDDLEIGELVGEALEKAGPNAEFQIQLSRTGETLFRIEKGLRLPNGYLSPHFITHFDSDRAVLEEPFILLCDAVIRRAEEILPVLMHARNQNRSLLIIAENVEGEALSILTANSVKGAVKVAAAKIPGQAEKRVEWFQDLELYTGASVLSSAKGTGLVSFDPGFLGRVESARLDTSATFLVRGAGISDVLDRHRDALLGKLQDSCEERKRGEIEKRLHRISGSAAILEVGSPTASAAEEKRVRVEKALKSALAARREGLVTGGGIALFRAGKVLDNIRLSGDEATGLEVVRRAIEEPLRIIAENAGEKPTVAIEKANRGKNGFGFNAKALEWGDLGASGIVDALQVCTQALETAVSIASGLLATECVITPVEASTALRTENHQYSTER